MTKRCTSRSGEDLTLSVRMSVVHTAGAPGTPSTPFLTCLVDWCVSRQKPVLRTAFLRTYVADSTRVRSCDHDSHGPHTWTMPVQSSYTRPPGQMLEDSGWAVPPDTAGGADYISETMDTAANAAGLQARANGTSAAQQRLRQRRRVPLPREAVAELRTMLQSDRYPQPEAREDVARRYGLERRRVDRWLENARAREASRAGSTFKRESI
jgi:hypothetical protein